MRTGIWQEFDGYDRVAAQRDAARRAGPPYTLERTDPGPWVARLHPDRLALRVVEVLTETPSTKTLRLAPDSGRLPPFLAGQYTALLLQIDHLRTGRPYSISSSPSQTGHWDVTVRRVDGGLVSNYLLDEVAVGDRLECSGPQGVFHFNPLIHRPDLVCIAGGSGITPFMSMLREIADRGLDRRVTLLYGSRRLDDVIFHQELQALAARFDRIRYVPVIQTPPEGFQGCSGLITTELIRAVCGPLDDKSVFVCGPKGLYDFCLPQLEALGLDPRRVRREMYGTPVSIFTYPGWPPAIDAGRTFAVSIRGGATLAAPAGEALLAVLEKNAVAPPSNCRSGECSLCRVQVLRGRVYQPAGVAVRRADRRSGYVHACVAYPLEDLEIRL